MKTRRSPEHWVVLPHPQPQARLRLFCFPYAGGGASIYRTWPKGLPSEIEIWVEGQPVEDLEKTCSDPRPQRYQVNVRLPEHVGPGLHHLKINIGHRKLPSVPIEVVV